MSQNSPSAEFKKFVAEFKNESERAVVVLTAARLDYLLQQVLQKFLIPNSSKSDEFFENQGPGSTFSNKILLAYRLGLLDRQFTSSLNLIRKIRNDFAHEPSECSLSKGRHKEQVRSLIAPYQSYDFFTVFRTQFLPDVDDAKALYMTVLGLLIIRLDFLFRNIMPRPTDMAWPVFNDKMISFKKGDEKGEKDKEPDGNEVEAKEEKGA